MRGKILVVDDEKNMAELLETDLKIRDFEAACHTSADDALAALAGQDFDVVLTDLMMPGKSGIELCQQVVALRPDIPVVVMTAFGSMDTAVAAIRAGAYDFVTKPIESDMLALTLGRAVEHRQLKEKINVLTDAVQDSNRIDDMIGESEPMQEVYRQLPRIAQADASVLISGESGTGKELIARSIHRQSERRKGPFVPINCSALPENLLESELFGHAKGAFTDARADRKGLFVQAEGGTLFMDEVGEMPLAMQPKLLRALEEGRVRPVGSDIELAFDVRIVAATNRDLETEIEEQRFREDLFYRINVIEVQLPPLRARGTDVLLLAHYFVSLYAGRSKKEVVGISEAAAEKLLSYHWPGNVRELRNVIERAVALTRFDRIAPEDLPKKINEYRSSDVFIGGDDPNDLIRMDEVERRYIMHVVRTVGSNKTLAAKILGLDRKTLYRKLQQYGEIEG